MVAHCAIQALGVAYITGNIWLGLGEFCAHFIIDYMKCTKRLTFNQDQALHIVCKCAWALI